MPSFRFRLGSLLRYRRNRRDLCLQVLSQILAEDQKLVAQRVSLIQRRQSQLDELRTIGQGGSLNVDAAASRRYFVGQLTGEIRMVEHNRGIVAQQLELCRKALSQAERDVKILEKLEEKQMAEFRYHQLRIEDRELEETWQASHMRENSQ